MSTSKSTAMLMTARIKWATARCFAGTPTRAFSSKSLSGRDCQQCRFKRSGLIGVNFSSSAPRLPRDPMRRVGEFIREFHAEVNGQRRDAELTTGLKRRELDEVQRKLDGLIEAMGRLLPGA